MLRKEILSFKVKIPVENLDENKKVRSSTVANYLLKQLSGMKACEYGYFITVAKLISIGPGDCNSSPEHVIFPVVCCCKMLAPVNGEVMTGVVHKVSNGGVYIKTGPMKFVYLPAHWMPNYSYVVGENPSYVREDMSRIEIGVVVCFRVFHVQWLESKHREFVVLARIDDDGLVLKIIKIQSDFISLYRRFHNL